MIHHGQEYENASLVIMLSNPSKAWTTHDRGEIWQAASVQRIVIGAFHALHSGEGRPVVYLHGFPDHPPTAVPLLRELVRRGHRVLAPWLRGYAPSPIEGPFDLDTLLDDVRGLIDRWLPDLPVDVIGHDWGAAITYALCIAAPERVTRAVTIALPHPLTFLRQLRTPAQLQRSWYLALLRLPGSGRIARLRDLGLIDLLWRRWSPGWELDPQRRTALHACLAASLPAPLGYYRDAARGGVRDRLARLARPIVTPVLELHGARDGCVLPPTLDDRHRFASSRVRELVLDAGHFLHLEAPEATANRIAAWFAAMDS